MRIALAASTLEAVTFLPEPIGARFERSAMRGADLMARLRGTSSVLGAFAQGCEEGAEMIGIVSAEEQFDVIALRSKTHVRAVYEPVEQEVVLVETPIGDPPTSRRCLIPARGLAFILSHDAQVTLGWLPRKSASGPRRPAMSASTCAAPKPGIRLLPP
jgi:hypothetical protein